jgi:hypothetical protein
MSENQNVREKTMIKSKGIHAHDFFKLGKAPAKKDKRNFKMATLWKALPTIPKEWDFDVANAAKSIPTPMFGNDVHGDCVIAGRAHQTLRFELIEQKKVLPITEKDVLREYWKQEGGTGPDFDKGLIVLDSINLWRSKGWKANNRKYTIHAFAQIDQMDEEEVRAAIYLLTGAGCGLQLPDSASAQLTAGKPWDVTKGKDSAPGSWGGHYVYLSGYTAQGPVCITWGRKQQMTWKFLKKYCDELYALVDNRNWFVKKSPIDAEKLERYLSQI